MEIEIKGKKYEVKEIPYMEAIDINPEDKKGMIRRMFKASLEISDEEIDKLTIKEGKIIEEVVMKINGLMVEGVGFQNQSEKKESSTS